MERTNIDNQRKAAVAFLATQSGVEAITFTQDGSVGGGGSWAVNAVITIEGAKYQEILGLDEYTYGGQPMPSVRPSATRDPVTVTVTYSDGSSEVFR